jgi:hypothetical protein
MEPVSESVSNKSVNMRSLRDHLRPRDNPSFFIIEKVGRRSGNHVDERMIGIHFVCFGFPEGRLRPSLTP